MVVGMNIRSNAGSDNAVGSVNQNLSINYYEAAKEEAQDWKIEQSVIEWFEMLDLQWKSIEHAA